MATIQRQADRLSKFTKGRMTEPFQCRMCLKKRPADWSVDRIVFGRRQWYPICKNCAPQHGVLTTVTGKRKY